MDGIHDLGGMEGFGPPTVDPNEPVFHEEWERRMLGITFCTFRLGLSNGGEFRHAIERMDPVHYLVSPYYEHWFTGVATRLVETGRLSRESLETRADGAVRLSRPVAKTGVSAAPPVADVAVGDIVRVRQTATRGHTRCPRYVRGHTGVVVRVDDPASLPDLEAHSNDRRFEPTACVRFRGRDLWGDGAEAAVVHVDLWTSYLERGT